MFEFNNFYDVEWHLYHRPKFAYQQKQQRTSFLPKFLYALDSKRALFRKR